MQLRLAWQQLPWLTSVAIGTPEKMGVIVTHFCREVVFYLICGRDSGQVTKTNASSKFLICQ
jgi:hypothetical protein